MKHIVSRMSSYFPNRWPLSYLNLTKNMKTYIRRLETSAGKEDPVELDLLHKALLKLLKRMYQMQKSVCVKFRLWDLTHLTRFVCGI